MPKVTRKGIDKDLEQNFRKMVEFTGQWQDKSLFAIWPEFQPTKVNQNISGNNEQSLKLLNPAYLKKTIKFYKIDEIGSNMDPKKFNPHKVAQSENDYFENLVRTGKI